MKTINDKHENDFRKLLQHTLEEKPSSDFTQKLMKQISLPQPLGNSAQKSMFVSSLLWVGLIMVFFTIGAGVIYYFRIQLFTDQSFDVLIPVIKSLLSSFHQMFTTFSISPLTIAIILGILSLVLIDRFLRTRAFKKEISSMMV